MLTLPVNWCVLADIVPNLVEPVTKSWDDVIVWTIKVCAVIVPGVTILPDIFKEPVIVCVPLNVLLPVVAKEDVLAFKDDVYASNVPTRVFKDAVVVYNDEVAAFNELIAAFNDAVVVLIELILASVDEV